MLVKVCLLPSRCLLHFALPVQALHNPAAQIDSMYLDQAALQKDFKFLDMLLREASRQVCPSPPT